MYTFKTSDLNGTILKIRVCKPKIRHWVIATIAFLIILANICTKTYTNVSSIKLGIAYAISYITYSFILLGAFSIINRISYPVCIEVSIWGIYSIFGLSFLQGSLTGADTVVINTDIDARMTNQFKDIFYVDAPVTLTVKNEEKGIEFQYVIEKDSALKIVDELNLKQV